MDLNTLFLLLVGLACPVGMGLMMWMMNKNMSQSTGNLRKNKEVPFDLEDSLMQLRLQRQLLDDEIAELEHATSGSNKVIKQRTKSFMIQADRE